MRKLTMPLFSAALLTFGLSCGGLVEKDKVTTNASSLKGADLGGYSCEHQAAWGKCGEGWMHPTCDYICGGGGGSASIGGYSCEQQAAWGKCGEGWMHPTCDLACAGGQLLYYYQLPNGQVVPVYSAPAGGNPYGGNPNYYPGDRQYTTGGLLYPDLGAHNGGYGGGYGGGYTTGGLLYPDLGAHNGGGYYRY